jgi:hypothetical protein
MTRERQADALREAREIAEQKLTRPEPVKEMGILPGDIQLPSGDLFKDCENDPEWRDPQSTKEDPRKTGLKNGLRQLTSAQIRRVLDYPIEKMALDDGNYIDGKFCPLAIALGIDETMKNPSDDRVHAVLTLLGYRVNNTRNVYGTFYTTDRGHDLHLAAMEVLRERDLIRAHLETKK